MITPVPTTAAPTTTTTTTTPVPCNLNTHHRPGGSQTCEEKKCSCPVASAAQQRALPAPSMAIANAHRATTWRHLNPLTHECDLNTCSCPHGQIATDRQCTQDGGHICVSGTCHAGYHMVGTQCKPFGGSCAKGALAQQQDRQHHDHCGSCDAGHRLTGASPPVCTAWAGSCANGCSSRRDRVP